MKFHHLFWGEGIGSWRNHFIWKTQDQILQSHLLFSGGEKTTKVTEMIKLETEFHCWNNAHPSVSNIIIEPLHTQKENDDFPFKRENGRPNDDKLVFIPFQ